MEMPAEDHTRHGNKKYPVRFCITQIVKTFAPPTFTTVGGGIPGRHTPHPRSNPHLVRGLCVLSAPPPHSKDRDHDSFFAPPNRGHVLALNVAFIFTNNRDARGEASPTA